MMEHHYISHNYFNKSLGKKKSCEVDKILLNASTHASMTKLGVFTSCHFNNVEKKMHQNSEIFVRNH